MSKPTDDQIAKLPAWARNYIRDLQRERETAVRELNEYCDSQTPSRIWHEEYVSTGEQQGPSLKRHYVQARKITVCNTGVELDVYAHEDNGLRLQWSHQNGFDEIAMIPISFMCVRLMSKDNMR